MGTALFTVAALRGLEADAAKSLPRGTLMQRAGLAAAGRVAQRLGSAPKSVAVVCGSGNNGGDGYVCALELKRLGHQVVCFALAPPSTEDAKAVAARWRANGGEAHDAVDPKRAFDATVDAMFGIGLTRPLDGTYRQAAEWISAQRGLRVALDVPSGLDADHGAWVGGQTGVTADLTITFLGAKPGLFTGAGCDAAGEVFVEPIGVALPPTALRLLDQSDFAAVATPRAHDSHKGDYGNVGVLGGGAGMVGAALLAARAALRIGAGRVFVECTGARDLQFDPLYPELMLRALHTVERLDAVVVGCGLGADASAQAALDWALGAKSPVVFDADALNLLARERALRTQLRARDGASILTPHPLEAARLLGTTASEVQADRIGRALALAHEANATVVLKGAGTVIATADGRAWINTTGGPALATPGSGDVLGGMIGALLAQGFAPLEATFAAVWLHGAAVRRHHGDIGLVAGEIAALAVQCLVDLRDLRAGASARP